MLYVGLSQRTSSSFTPTVSSCCLVTVRDEPESSFFKRSEASIIENSTNIYKYCESHKKQTCNKKDVRKFCFVKSWALKISIFCYTVSKVIDRGETVLHLFSKLQIKFVSI